MKNIFFFLIILTGAAAPAQTYRTQDNQLYIVTLDNESLTQKGIEKCLKRICRLAQTQGNGQCDHLENLGVVLADLTTFAAQKVNEMTCVLAVDKSGGVYHANPRVGRQN